MNGGTEAHWSASGLLSIDVQRDTLDGRPLEIGGTSATVLRLRSVACAKPSGETGRTVFMLFAFILLTEATPNRADAILGRAAGRCCSRARPAAPWHRLEEPDVDDSTTRCYSEVHHHWATTRSPSTGPRWGGFDNTAIEAVFPQL
jgi:hypothetical protein